MSVQSEHNGASYLRCRLEKAFLWIPTVSLDAKQVTFNGNIRFFSYFAQSQVRLFQRFLASAVVRKIRVSKIGKKSCFQRFFYLFNVFVQAFVITACVAELFSVVFIICEMLTENKIIGFQGSDMLA